MQMQFAIEWHGVGHESRGLLDVRTAWRWATGHKKNTLHADSERAVSWDV